MYTQQEAITFYNTALLNVFQSRLSFTAFLEVAAQHYKHSVVNQVMIYTQKQSARLVAEEKIWNRLGGKLKYDEPIISILQKEDVYTTILLYDVLDISISQEKIAPFSESWSDEEKARLQKLLAEGQEQTLSESITKLVTREYNLLANDIPNTISEETAISLSSYLVGRKLGIIEKNSFSKFAYTECYKKQKSFDKVFQWINLITKNTYTNLTTIKKEWNTNGTNTTDESARTLRQTNLDILARERTRRDPRPAIAEQITFDDYVVTGGARTGRVQSLSSKAKPAPAGVSGVGLGLHEKSAIDEPIGYGSERGNASIDDGENSTNSGRNESAVSRILRVEENSESLAFETIDPLSYKGSKTKYKLNIQAIRTLKQIEKENRLATPEEIKILKGYVGWGSIPEAFDSRKENWKKEYEELQGLLTEEEYSNARRSTLNAHYTPPEIIKPLYKALDDMGVHGGRLLDPSAGNGRFFSELPQTWQTTLNAVELDSISGRITQNIHQNATVAIQGYQDTAFPNNYFDGAISNVPFGDYKVPDKQYDKLNLSIHEYFFAKSLDKVKPNGFVAFVTSKYLLDKKDLSFRKYLAQRAELVGAVRLPAKTFMDIANTEVTTDILILKKRDTEIVQEQEWTYLGITETGVPVNEYYINHSENLLGEMVYDKSFFGNEMETACINSQEDFDLPASLSIALDSIVKENGKVFEQLIEPTETTTVIKEIIVEEKIPADPQVKNYTYTLVNDALYYRENDDMLLQDLDTSKTERIRGLHQIRQDLMSVIDTQLISSDDILLKEKQTTLNNSYDAFVKKYGYLNSRTNDSVFKEDADRPLLEAIEEKISDKEYEKADIFFKRTITDKKEFEIKSVDDALVCSLNESGTVDIPFMSGALQIEKEELIKTLGDKIYQDPENGKYITAEEYLSGDVKEKLEIVNRYLEEKPEYKRNQIALQEVLPARMPLSEISFSLTSEWIPEELKISFMHSLLKIGFMSSNTLTLKKDKFDTSYTLKNWRPALYSCQTRAEEVYGTARRNAFQLFEDSLNSRISTVRDSVDDGYGNKKSVLNEKETQLAREKQKSLNNEFVSWIQLAPSRVEEIENVFNDNFNVYVNRSYNGDALVIPNISTEITLRKHQKDAVARIVLGGNTLLAHEVGAGKTYTMASAVMFGKHVGIYTKPMIIIPNHMLDQWTKDFYKIFPSANLLITTKKDFEKNNRQRFISRIATGEYDAIIMTFSQFEKIPMSPEYRKQSINTQIADIENTIMGDEDWQDYSVKRLEKMKAGLEAKLTALSDAGEKDNTLYFEQLGIDALFVDEAHYYKNCFVQTKIQNVAGLGTSSAEKSFDFLLKTQYLNKKTNYHGVVFATGTPVTNSLSELFVMQRYLQNNVLQDMDIATFDEWASAFATRESVLEISPEGTGYRDRTRFTTFDNLPQLMTVFRMVADIKLIEDLDIKRPTIETGKPQTILVEPNEYVQSYMKELAERADRVRNGGVPPYEDNMLLITSNGRNVAIDPSLVDEFAPNTKDSKIYVACDNIARIHKEYEADRALQLVFLDVGIGLYTTMKEELIQQGVAEHEIAFIHDANSDTQKASLFKKCRNGDIRVLFGSTTKMGAGTNIQDRLIALHDIDCPWRPADLEQRHGRILRQGNQYSEVKIFQYVTKGTFDSYLFQTIENKQRLISQIMSNKSAARSCADIDETVLNYSDIKALATGDTRIKEKMELDNDVKRLTLEKSAFISSQNRLKHTIETAPELIEKISSNIEKVSNDLQSIQKPDPFAITLNNKLYDKRADAAQALANLIPKEERTEITIGNYAGLALAIEKSPVQDYLVLKGEYSYLSQLGNSSLGNISRIENILETIPQRINNFKTDKKRQENELQSAKENYGGTFEKNDELMELIEKQTTLNLEIEAELHKDDVVEVEESRKLVL